MVELIPCAATQTHTKNGTWWLIYGEPLGTEHTARCEGPLKVKDSYVFSERYTGKQKPIQRAGTGELSFTPRLPSTP